MKMGRVCVCVCVCVCVIMLTVCDACIKMIYCYNIVLFTINSYSCSHAALPKENVLTPAYNYRHTTIAVLLD